jgi:hypothetical protein
MSNEKEFAAHLLEQGIVSCFIHERSACMNPKTTGIYTCGVAHKTAEIRSQIIGLMRNRTGKGGQPEVPIMNFNSYFYLKKYQVRTFLRTLWKMALSTNFCS